MKKRRSRASRKAGKIVPKDLGANNQRWREMRRKVNEAAPLNKQWSVEEKESILDYLHGDVLPREVKACCYYEYARASETLRRARREYNPSLDISRYFPGWLLDAGRCCFWQCKDFPHAAWHDLSKEERENFRLLFKPISPSPIITDLLTLRRIGVLDAFVTEGENALNEFKRRVDASERMTKRVIQPAVVEVSEDRPFIKRVVITVDYRDGIETVKQQFANWLATEANQKLFDHYDYHNSAIDKRNPDSPTRYKELLKYLAAWRLYDELGFEKAAEWTKTNRREYNDRLLVKPFFREKARKIVNGKKYFFGPLYKEPRLWEAANAKAQSFLVKEIERGSGMT